METYYSWKRRIERREKSKRCWETVKEVVGGIAVMVVMFVFCALCVLGSGYNWE